MKDIGLTLAQCAILAACVAMGWAMRHFLRPSLEEPHFAAGLIKGLALWIVVLGAVPMLVSSSLWRASPMLTLMVMIGVVAFGARVAYRFWRDMPTLIDTLEERQRGEEELEIANQRLSESLTLLRRRSRELDTLSYLGTLLQRSNNSTELATMVARAAADLSLSSSGAVFLYENEQAVLRALAAWGDDEVRGSELSALQCHMLTGRSGTCHYACRKNLNPLMEDTHLCITLKDKVETFGVLQFHGIASFDDPHLQSLVQSLSEHASMALSNMRLREGLLDLSVRDPLTGLFNRRYLDDVLRNEEKRVRNNLSQSVGVVIFDLDFFKRINDGYGHDAGDLALQTFAKILLSHTRTGDIASRSGGEEFVLVLPGLDAQASAQRADVIRAAMAQKTVHYGTATLGMITVSAGIAALPETGATTSDVLRAADWALYQAKEQGRNRCVIADPVLFKSQRKAS